MADFLSQSHHSSNLYVLSENFQLYGRFSGEVVNLQKSFIYFGKGGPRCNIPLL